MSDDTGTVTDESTDGASDINELEVSLGRCYYGDFDEQAVAVASKPDDTGWIAVCEEHKSQAEQEGYEVRPDSNIATADASGEGDNGTDADE